MSSRKNESTPGYSLFSRASTFSVSRLRLTRQFCAIQQNILSVRPTISVVKYEKAIHFFALPKKYPLLPVA